MRSAADAPASRTPAHPPACRALAGCAAVSACVAVSAARPALRRPQGRRSCRRASIPRARATDDAKTNAAHARLAASLHTSPRPPLRFVSTNAPHVSSRGTVRPRFKAATQIGSGRSPDLAIFDTQAGQGLPPSTLRHVPAQSSPAARRSVRRSTCRRLRMRPTDGQAATPLRRPRNDRMRVRGIRRRNRAAPGRPAGSRRRLAAEAPEQRARFGRQAARRTDTVSPRGSSNARSPRSCSAGNARQARRRAAPPPDVSFRKRNRRPDVSALRTRRAHALRGGHERPMARLSQSRLARRARVPIDVAGWSCAGSQTIGNWQGNAFFGPPQHAQKAARRCGLRALGGR